MSPKRQILKRLSVYIINLVDKTKRSRYTPHRRSTTIFLETHQLYSLFIIIAHRLNTVKNCDGILLLNEGQSRAT